MRVFALYTQKRASYYYLLSTRSSLIHSCPHINRSLFVIPTEQGSLLKPKRIRTTFSEDQLQILNANFNLDPNPDGHDLERIAKQTGLSKRVTQVWFQNSRARQKKQSSNSGNVLSFISFYLNLPLRSIECPLGRLTPVF